jgi:DNA-binding transcriptional ArsR family regulator
MANVDRSNSRQQLLNTLAQVARGLGNGNRLELLECLAQAEAPVEALAQATSLSVANASQHLQQLRRAGLVTARRDGRHMFYRLTDERIVTLLGLLQQIAESNLAEVERLVGKLFADADGALEAMSRDDLLSGLERGEVTLLDVRPAEEYRAGHLAGHQPAHRHPGADAPPVAARPGNRRLLPWAVLRILPRSGATAEAPRLRRPPLCRRVSRMEGGRFTGRYRRGG